MLSAADAERAHLRRIAVIAARGCDRGGLDCGASATQIVPIYLGSNETALHVAAQLRDAGFAVRAIRPPTVPAGTSRIRLSLTARITMDEIHRLARGHQRRLRSRLHQASFQLPRCMPNDFFITGTDTGVGKTVVSALLCAALDAIYWKPIQTGTREGTDREP